jgi:hypothetical protein
MAQTAEVRVDLWQLDLRIFRDFQQDFTLRAGQPDR